MLGPTWMCFSWLCLSIASSRMSSACAKLSLYDMTIDGDRYEVTMIWGASLPDADCCKSHSGTRGRGRSRYSPAQSAWTGFLLHSKHKNAPENTKTIKCDKYKNRATCPCSAGQLRVSEPRCCRLSTQKLSDVSNIIVIGIAGIIVLKVITIPLFFVMITILPERQWAGILFQEEAECLVL